MQHTVSEAQRAQVRRERWRLLRQIDHLANPPLVILSLVWVVLVIVDLTHGLTPAMRALNYCIWALFALDFLLEWFLAPNKARYLRRHWITAVALVLPVVRFIRIFALLRLLQTGRVLESVTIVRVLATTNRGIHAVRTIVHRRGVGYVLALSVLVVLIGAAATEAFENPAALQAAGYGTIAQQGGIPSYGDALWWTAMMLTTMGSDYFPHTVPGRILGFLLAVYGFAVFGFITANIASYFVGNDVQHQSAQTASDSDAHMTEIRALRQEIAALRADLAGRDDPT